MTTPLFSFEAHSVTGSGRGKGLKVPTINIALEDIPEEMEEGIYACFVSLGDERHPASLHYGPRPVFKDSLSFEVHLLDTEITNAPEMLFIEVIEYLRPVSDFPSPEELLAQIASDNDRARAILSNA